MNSPTKTPPSTGWILYDGGCGFCSWWVPFWEKTLNKAGFSIVPLQEPWVAERAKLSESELLDDLRILFHDNRTISGAASYIFIMKRIWWAWPLGQLFSIPGFHWIFKKGYAVFNRNRFRISKVCRLPAKYEKN